MATLIFDIETVGENFADLDQITKDALTHWLAEKYQEPAEYNRRLGQVKTGLGLSPLTGQIVSLGLLDYEKNQGVVYYQTNQTKISIDTKDNFTFKPATEAELLEQFWQGAKHYDTFVSFNGRMFDVPFMFVRSAIWHLRPSKNLMANRYLNSQPAQAKHIDLLDQLTFYGASRQPANNFHLWSRAFNIDSPKAKGVSGSQVAKFFAEGQIKAIAQYNAEDVIATAKLFKYWDQYLRW